MSHCAKRLSASSLFVVACLLGCAQLAAAASVDNNVVVTVTIESPTVSGGGTTGGGSTGGGSSSSAGPQGLRPPSIIEKIFGGQTPPPTHTAATPPVVPPTITSYNPTSPPLIFEKPIEPPLRGAAETTGTTTVPPRTSDGGYECADVEMQCNTYPPLICEEASFECIAGSLMSDVQNITAGIAAQYPSLEMLRKAHPVELGMWLFVLIILGFMIRTFLLAILSLFEKRDSNEHPGAPLLHA